MEVIGKHTESLEFLDPILAEWLTLVRDIHHAWRPDIPWRYGERTSLSLFAGAVWHLGGIVLEEFTTEKPSGDAETFTWGRADMYFEFNDLECEIEAKSIQPRIGPSARPARVVERALASAVADASRSRHYDSRHHLGFVSVVPKVSISRLGVDADFLMNWSDHLRRWLDQITSINNTACAWYFPDDIELASFEDSPKREQYLPGTAILLRGVDSYAS